MDQQQKSVPEFLRKKFYFSDWIAKVIIKSVAFVSFVIIILIFVFVFREAFPLFSYDSSKNVIQEEELIQESYGEEHIDVRIQTEDEKISPETGSSEKLTGESNSIWSNIFSTTWEPISEQPKYGILPLVAGSFKVTLIAILIAAPIAILSALFTSTFAPKWMKEVLKPAIEILAGFPSVVIGFFALIILATFLQNIFGFQYRLNAFVGGLAMSLAIIPIIYTITEDALSAIPKSYIEASYALGAQKWQTALFVVLPAASPGIFAAVLLGIGRAFGETMIVLMATGNSALISLSPFEPVRTMSATIGAEMAEVIFGELHYNILFLLGSILFLFAFTTNAIAEFLIRNRLLKKMRGES